MFKVLFGRNEVKETIDPRHELYEEMRTSLSQYKEALSEYSEVRRDFDEGSTLVAHALAVLEHYRTRYYNLRLKYESSYGNVEVYTETVSNLTNWEKESGLRLLLRPITDPFLINRS